MCLIIGGSSRHGLWLRFAQRGMLCSRGARLWWAPQLATLRVFGGLLRWPLCWAAQLSPLNWTAFAQFFASVTSLRHLTNCLPSFTVTHHVVPPPWRL